MRWWREFCNPALKCERVGHDIKTRAYGGYETSKSTWCVAYRVKGTIVYCPRCRFVATRTVDGKDAIHSLTLDQDRYDRLKDEGFIEC